MWQYIVLLPLVRYYRYAGAEYYITYIKHAGASDGIPSV